MDFSRLRIYSLNRIGIICFVFMLLLCSVSVQGSDLVMPHVFTSNMVMQRGVAMPIWGKSSPGAEVEVTFAGRQVSTKADGNGNWRVMLDAMPANDQGQTLTIKSADETITLKDILVGEVWICAGQSNMAWTLKLTPEGEQTALESKNINGIRLFDPQITTPWGKQAWPLELDQTLTPESFFAYEGWTHGDEEVSGRFSAIGYYFGKMLHDELNVPIGLIDVAVGGTPVQAWIPRQKIVDDPELHKLEDEFLDCTLADIFVNERASLHLKEWIDAGKPGKKAEHHYRPGFMYQAGIEPYKGLPVAGIIWYQGESNAEDIRLHNKMFPMAVKSWRDAFGRQDLPVICAQLPGIYRYAWPEFRESQADLSEATQSGLAVTIDMGDPKNVHPRNKLPVGRRMARIALSRVYGKSIVDAGPTIKSVSPDNGALVLTFNNTASGLELRESESGDSGFWIAGEDKRFAKAQAELVDNKIVLTSDKVSHPVAVRYAWEPYPPVTLYNGEGLPAAPFRSDNWHTLRAACVGDSITYGMGTSNTNIYSYPAQLENQLGPLFDVRNYGVSGSTVVNGFVLKNWDRGYALQLPYRRSIFHNPDIVIINLGINDVNEDPFDPDRFVEDYVALIDSYRKLPSKPKVFIWGKLAPIYEGHKFYRDPRLELIQQAIDRVVADTGVATIDMNAPLKDLGEHFADKIHPDDYAAGVIATKVHEALTNTGLPTPADGSEQSTIDLDRSPSFGDREEVIARSLHVTRFLKKKYSHDTGPLVLKPVVVPYGENLLGNNSHFGWPVAVKDGDTIIVAFTRKPQHTPRWGIKKPKDKYFSETVITRSNDGGNTWSKPVDIRTYVKQETKNCRISFGNGMVRRSNGEVVLVSSYGVFTSTDHGASWEHHPHAYSEDDIPGPVICNGPKLLEHPEYGVVSFGHGKNEELIVRYSKDGGRDWEQVIYNMPEPWAYAIEPTVILHNGAMVMVARCHGKESFEPERKTWRYMQAYSPDGWLPLKPALTTMRVTDVRDEVDIVGYGPFSQDTVALDYNPVTKRYEAVCTNRNGGGQGNEQQRLRMTLNLWSIDPQQIAAGSSDWRFEGTLLTRGGIMVTGSDGMHPGGAVIDEEAGVQHIFIYLGQHLGPASVFRLTRTLDTPKLVDWLKQYPE